MSEEEHLKKMMDRLNQNSHYGIMIDTEITKMIHDYIGSIRCDYDRLNCPKPPIYIGPVKVKSLKERLNEAYLIRRKRKMSDIYPLVIVKDRYNGTYSGGKWTAWNLGYVPSKVDSDDSDCCEFFSAVGITYGRGETPQEAIDDLNHFIRYGNHMTMERIKPVNESAESVELKKEISKLKNTTKKGDYIIYNGMPYMPSDIERLFAGIRQLEELKTPTIENFADEIPSTRADILDQAKKCVCGQREQDYGTPESNFQLIADLWNGYLGLCENGDGIPIFSIKSITPTDVSMMMALLKIARIKNGGGSGDSFVDLAGYAACGGEIWAGEKKSKDQK